MISQNIDFLSTREPTYWPAGHKKIPDLFLLFFLLLLTVYSEMLPTRQKSMLCNNNHLNESTDFKISLKTIQQIDDIVHIITKSIQIAAWNSTTFILFIQNNHSSIVPLLKEEILGKRRIQKRWRNK